MQIDIYGKQAVCISHLKEEFTFNTDPLSANCPVLIDFNNVKQGFNALYESYAKGYREFILDCSFEGPALIKEDGSKSILSIDFDEFFFENPNAKILFVTQNIACINDFNETYNKFSNSEAVYYNFIIYSYFNRTRFLNTHNQKNAFIKKLKLDAFRSDSILSLNNIAKPHRLVATAAIFELFGNNLKYVSFLGRNLSDKVLHDAQSLWQEGSDLLSQLYERVKFHGPITTNSESNDINPRNEGAFPVDLFSSTSLSIITESEFTNGRIKRITEKSLKSLICGHDFIIFGNPHTLKLLNTLGFDTSSEFSDGSYDEVLEPTSRLKCLLKDLRSISDLEPDMLEKLRLSSIERKLSNIDVFTSNYADYSSAMRSNLINKIKSFR